MVLFTVLRPSFVASLRKAFKQTHIFMARWNLKITWWLGAVWLVGSLAFFKAFSLTDPRAPFALEIIFSLGFSGLLIFLGTLMLYAIFEDHFQWDAVGEAKAHLPWWLYWGQKRAERKILLTLKKERKAQAVYAWEEKMARGDSKDFVLAAESYLLQAGFDPLKALFEARILEAQLRHKAGHRG